MTVEALFFDLDQTLVDSRVSPSSVLQTCNAVSALRPELDANQLFVANGEVWTAYWPGVEAKWTLGYVDGATVSREAWRLTLAASGCYDESLAEFMRDTHRRLALAEIRLFDDAQEFLGVARSRIPLALITNGASDTQRDKLTAAGIVQHFAVTVISGEIGAAKPDSTPFQVALEALGVDPANVWHIGDSLTIDVAGAKAAGLRTVWLNRERLVRRPDQAEPDIEVSSLTELVTMLG